MSLLLPLLLLFWFVSTFFATNCNPVSTDFELRMSHYSTPMSSPYSSAGGGAGGTSGASYDEREEPSFLGSDRTNSSMIMNDPEYECDAPRYTDLHDQMKKLGLSSEPDQWFGKFYCY